MKPYNLKEVQIFYGEKYAKDLLESKLRLADTCETCFFNINFKCSKHGHNIALSDICENYKNRELDDGFFKDRKDEEAAIKTEIASFSSSTC